MDYYNVMDKLVNSNEIEIVVNALCMDDISTVDNIIKMQEDLLKGSQIMGPLDEFATIARLEEHDISELIDEIKNICKSKIDEMKCKLIDLCKFKMYEKEFSPNYDVGYQYIEYNTNNKQFIRTIVTPNWPDITSRYVCSALCPCAVLPLWIPGPERITTHQIINDKQIIKKYVNECISIQNKNKLELHSIYKDQLKKETKNLIRTKIIKLNPDKTIIFQFDLTDYFKNIHMGIAFSD